LRLADSNGCIAEVVIEATVIQYGTAYDKIFSVVLHMCPFIPTDSLGGR